MSAIRIRVLVEVGLTIALSAVLGLLSVWQMPQGGSVSFVMLPIFVLAIRRGWRVGMAAGALYGVVDFMIERYLFHPVQALLDYAIAFALCGLAGIFAARWAESSRTHGAAKAFWIAALPGVVLASLARYAAHVLSGVVFFASYAVEAGQAPLVYSLAYNSFVLVSGGACAVAAAAVLPALRRGVDGAEA